MKRVMCVSSVSVKRLSMGIAMNVAVAAFAVAMTMGNVARADGGGKNEGLIAIQPKSATLPQAINAFANLLENSDAKAAEKWAKDDKAAEALATHWNGLAEAHKKFDYRKWIEGVNNGVGGANKIGDEKTFTVGGHAYGYLHLVWEKTEGGWRIGNVFMCR